MLRHSVYSNIEQSISCGHFPFYVLSIITGRPIFFTQTKQNVASLLSYNFSLGKRLSDVFSPKVDTGELKEPEKMDGKWRWQISLLEMMEPDQQSINESLQSDTAEDEEDISETLYRQGVYMNWENTLLDLRTAFIDTKQIEKDEASFCFLWTDVLGEHIDIDSESGTCLSRLSRSAVSSRTVYIERVDQG